MEGIVEETKMDNFDEEVYVTIRAKGVYGYAKVHISYIEPRLEEVG